MRINNEIVLIYDGQCEFCSSCLSWFEKKMQVTALAFQSAELGKYGLTKEQCAQQIYVIYGGKSYAGAGAVGFLLQARGNRFLARLIKTSGGLGRFGYRWVASHRDFVVVKIFARALQIRGR